MSENRLNFLTTRGFRMKISMKLVYQYMAIFFNFSPTSNHLHPRQVENCDSNSRLVVDEEDNGKFRLVKNSNINTRTIITRVNNHGKMPTLTWLKLISYIASLAHHAYTFTNSYIHPHQVRQQKVIKPCNFILEK